MNKIYSINENNQVNKEKKFKIFRKARQHFIKRLFYINKNNNKNNKLYKDYNIKNDDIKNDDIKNDDIKNDDIKNDDIKNDDIKNDNIKNDKENKYFFKTLCNKFNIGL